MAVPGASDLQQNRQSCRPLTGCENMEARWYDSSCRAALPVPQAGRAAASSFGSSALSEGQCKCLASWMAIVRALRQDGRQFGSAALITGACARRACAGRLGRRSRWKHTCAAR